LANPIAAPLSHSSFVGRYAGASFEIEGVRFLALLPLMVELQSRDTKKVPLDHFGTSQPMRTGCLPKLDRLHGLHLRRPMSFVAAPSTRFLPLQQRDFSEFEI
jgi:hypothetical protein